MSWVSTADLHIGSTIQGIDRFDAIKQVFGFAKREGVDFLVVAGDIYEHLLVSNVHRARFNRMVKKLSKHVEVILFPGNHDIGRKTNALAPIEPFADERVRIITSPSRFTRKGKRYLIIPYDVRMANDRRYLIKVFKKYAGEYEAVFGHWSISGAKVGPSNFSLITEVTKAKVKRYLKARYIILGHIHKPQKGGNIYYCGSPDYLNFGERHEQKRFLYHDGDQLDSIMVKTKPLVQVEMTVDKIRIVWNRQLWKQLVNKGIYKIVVECKKKEIPDIKLKELVDKIKSVGGIVVKVSWKITGPSRRRAKEINFRDSIQQNVKRYVKRFASKKEWSAVLTEALEALDEAAKDRD